MTSRFAYIDKNVAPGRILLQQESGEVGHLNFISLNIPTLLLLDDIDGSLIVPNEFEQKDLLATVNSFNGTVARSYTLSVQTLDERNAGNYNNKHIIYNETLGRISLNENVMPAFDRALLLAEQYNVRLIIPFIDHWSWMGGISDFATLVLNRNADGDTFYSDNTVVSEFKNIINQVLTRNNNFTGTTYLNDSNILCWETGNELYGAPSEWTVDIASYIKSVDSNHLVMEGTGVDRVGSLAIDDPNIDILTGHYYPILRLTSGDIAGVVILSILAILSVFMTIFTFTFLKRKWSSTLNTAGLEIGVNHISTVKNDEDPISIVGPDMEPSTSENRIKNISSKENLISKPSSDIDSTHNPSDEGSIPKHSKMNQAKKWYLKRPRSVIYLGIFLFIAFILGIVGILVNRHKNPNVSSLITKHAQMSLQSNKPFIIGEFGLMEYPTLKAIMDETIKSSQDFENTSNDYLITGSLLWSIRPHARTGGFYIHKELHGHWAYHYPGWNDNEGTGYGFASNERDIMDLLVNKNLEFIGNGNMGRNITVPDIPNLRWIENTSAGLQFNWRGSFGAMNYIIEYSTDGMNNWEAIQSRIIDAQPANGVIYTLVDNPPGHIYYRLRASNEAGTSDASNIVDIVS